MHFRGRRDIFWSSEPVIKGSAGSGNVVVHRKKNASRICCWRLNYAPRFLVQQMAFLLGYLGAAVGAALLLYLLLRTGWAWRIATDLPNHRSLHDLPVPRVGGWGMVPAWIVICSFIAQPYTWLFGVVLTLAAVSYVDDRFSLSPALRFPVHWLAAATVVFFTPGQVPVWILIISVVVIVWMTNLFNFMDGSDGLAGGMALFGFGSYALLAWEASDGGITALALAASGAALGFLCFNFHPARVFMGDAGSIPFGFLSGALGWLGVVKAIWPWWLPFLVFSPFVLDASVTLLRRTLRGEKVWQAHREHYYQRLVRMGFGHRNTALLYYALMFGAGASAVVLVRLTWALQMVGIAAWMVLFVVAARAVDRRWRNFLAEKTTC